MTSELRQVPEVYVWIWLPGRMEPVVAGRVAQERGILVFNYGRSYLARPEAIPIYLPELPLRQGRIWPAAGMAMPACLRDASPDAWGRRVIINRLMGRSEQSVDTDVLDELTYLLESGSDRIGALDFQASPTAYRPRHVEGASLEDLQAAADRIERGLPLPRGLDRAINPGTAVGGARPKTLISDGDRKYVAKFSSSTDIYSMVKAEFVAMRLAATCGLSVAPVSLRRVANKDVLLIDRFDRVAHADGWVRRAMVSALTLLELDEIAARYASYADLAEVIRHRFNQPAETLRELFGRLCFNILCGNTDDHARNHAAFWDGSRLTLTPGFDICPQGRSGQEATQAMAIQGDRRMARLSTALDAADQFLLRPGEASDLIHGQIETIAGAWGDVCAEAGLSDVDRRFFWQRQFFNPFSYQDLEGARAGLRRAAQDAVNQLAR